jgi:polar amino acid transport system ATP-binding protein
MEMFEDNAPVLRVSGVHKILGGKKILDDVSLTVDKRELKILIGPSGGGKSTLLQCINFLLPPDDGRIFLEGKEVHYHKKAELYAFRRQVGMIFQDFNLFDHLTARDNVSIALRKVKKIPKAEARDRAFHELERVGLADKTDLYPAELSGGQKQRVSIARALAMDPKAILLDEPTSALDPELIGEVLRVIVDLAKSGMTMIMATHQIGYVKSLTDEILFMEKGKIIERGRPEELLAVDSQSRCRGFCAMLNDLIGEL